MTNPSDPWWRVAEWNGVDRPFDKTGVGFTGTRRGMTDFQKQSVEQLLRQTSPDYVVHGDCVGADADFDTLVHKVLPAVHVTARPGHDKDGKSPHRANCDADVVYPAEPYLLRNTKIVEGTHILIATPDGPYRERSGTWYTVKFARGAGRMIYVVAPDGGIDVELPAIAQQSK